MSKADVIYNEVAQNIIDNGVWDKDQEVRTKWADGKPAYTKSIISQQIVFDGTEVPIITTKKVAWKTAIKELLWIWQMQNNNVDDLNEMGVRIWDEWKKEDGTIGPAYGYQMGKRIKTNRRALYANGDVDVHSKSHPIYSTQVDELLLNLQTNPASRRHVTTLWNIDDLADMALNPCVWHTQWLVKEGKLHLIVGVRSNDWALGAPFNQFQYYVLQRMIAQVTGYEMGSLIFNINDCHLYERHLESIEEQIQRTQFPAPTLWINPNITNFYDFNIDDFELIGYEHGEPVKMEVAI